MRCHSETKSKVSPKKKKTPSKAFVSELARLFQAYGDNSSLESITVKTITVLQALLLQKPSRGSKSSDHVTHLQRRLDLWLKGDIQALTNEGRCIQKHLQKAPSCDGDEATSRTFCKLMMEVQDALRYLFRNTSGGVLKLNDLIPMTMDNGESCSRSTFDILKEKHPPGKPPDPECLLHPPQNHHRSMQSCTTT